MSANVTLSNARARVLARLETVLPLVDLARLLWSVGVRNRRALWRQEELGLDLAEAMARLDAGTGNQEAFEVALERWIEAIEVAKEKRDELDSPHAPRPVWAFWANFTREGEPESPLSALLREEVGYPTDAEAGIPVPFGGDSFALRGCYVCGRKRRWRRREGTEWRCCHCSPSPYTADEIVVEDLSTYRAQWHRSLRRAMTRELLSPTDDVLSSTDDVLSRTDMHHLLENLDQAMEGQPGDEQAQRVYAVHWNIIDVDSPIWTWSVVEDWVSAISEEFGVRISVEWLHDRVDYSAEEGTDGWIIALPADESDFTPLRPGEHLASIALHECAHAITPTVASNTETYGTPEFQSHGPEFVACYLDLLTRVMDTVKARAAFELMSVRMVGHGGGEL